MKCSIMQQDGKLCGCEVDYILLGNSLCENHARDMHMTVSEIAETYIGQKQAVRNILTKKYADGRS